MLNKNDAALIIIDVQQQLLKIMDKPISAQLINNVNLFSQMFSYWGNPIIVTEQYPQGLGPTCDAVKQHLPQFQPVEKVTFSACGDASFNQQLAKLQTHNLILVGMEAHVCVLQTALQLLEKNYQVIIPVDAVQSSTKLRWKTGLNIAEKAGAVTSNTESILFQMVERADTEDFKQLLGLIKVKSISPNPGRDKK